MIKQNLKMLLLTSPGERIMEPRFGVGLRAYLFEQNTSLTHSSIETKINEQLNLYMPYVEIVELSFNDASEESNISENYLNVKLEYFVKPLEELDVVDLDFDFSKQLFI
jgi:phage baseplate assembly protein W